MDCGWAGSFYQCAKTLEKKKKSILVFISQMLLFSLESLEKRTQTANLLTFGIISSRRSTKNYNGVRFITNQYRIVTEMFYLMTKSILLKVRGFGKSLCPWRNTSRVAQAARAGTGSVCKLGRILLSLFCDNFLLTALVPVVIFANKFRQVSKKFGEDTVFSQITKIKKLVIFVCENDRYMRGDWLCIA